MKIGIVSDTHSRPVPRQVLDGFKNVDFIIHAGDFCSLDDLKIFQGIKDVKAVYGNMDDADIRKVLPRTQLIRCGKFIIGIFHGEGRPQGLLDVVRREFKGKNVDAVVFGHSHHPLNEVIDGVLYFNPGSPNDELFAPYCSYGFLTIGDSIKGKIVRIQ